MKNTITKQKLKKYKEVTGRALGAARENVIKGQEKGADEIIEMVENYLSDAGHFEEKGEWVDAFAALNYAHGWLDAGVRLGVFDVDDDSLFTVR
ncbi:hypothetical protein CMI37_38115 [Candidatus Pacearchaeota archaeon]|nr:hypothetical protein [Candidatus Pacearchaeota archaeon]|tara:strand:+ start:2128 stop:2409 length:282 start_codon:yes stop_codon:yes gene_type:complete